MNNNYYLVKKSLEYTLWKKSLGKSRTEQFSHDLAFVGFYTVNKIIKANDINKVIFIPASGSSEISGLYFSCTASLFQHSAFW